MDKQLLIVITFLHSLSQQYTVNWLKTYHTFVQSQSIIYGIVISKFEDLPEEISRDQGATHKESHGEY